MTDELQPTDAVGNDDFDWSAFFADDEEDVNQSVSSFSAEGGESGASDPDEDDLRAQLKEANERSAKALALAQQASQQSQMKVAIEAWEAQASPEELLAKPMLLEAHTPEELKAAADMAKRLSSSIGENLRQRDEVVKRQVEEQMQKQFGMPVPPTFQPIPEQERVKEMLKEGNIEQAAGAMLKGFFS